MADSGTLAVTYEPSIWFETSNPPQSERHRGCGLSPRSSARGLRFAANGADHGQPVAALDFPVAVADGIAIARLAVLNADRVTWINAAYLLSVLCQAMKDVIRHLPARLLTPDERALVAEWIAGAGDIPEAYVSNRRVDDPALYHRIVSSQNLKLGRHTLSTRHLVETSGLYSHWAVGQRFSGFVPFGRH